MFDTWPMAAAWEDYNGDVRIGQTGLVKWRILVRPSRSLEAKPGHAPLDL